MRESKRARGLIHAAAWLVSLLCISCAAEGTALKVSWKDNMLLVEGSGVPGGPISVWYLEAFCRPGSTDRKWEETTIPHTTRKLEEAKDGSSIKLLSEVEGGLEVVHEIRAGKGEVDFQVTATNRGTARVDADWVQPCMRVGGFTGLTQEDYIERCFIFVGGELTMLPDTRRTEEARYRGGQVYVPEGIDLADVNPRPISPDRPSNGLIGCYSADGRWILATAWQPYQELFQGVIVCIHSDFRLGGVDPGETRTARGKLYVMPADAGALLERYRRDFLLKT